MPTVVIPTYNERENIGPLLRALLDLKITDLSVLVVDDSSPDGTAEAARKIAATDPRVHLLLRPRKAGLGSAYTAAFQYLFSPDSRLKTPDSLVQMDADFSHNPQDIPRLLAALESADLAIGSRYVSGGGTENWGLGRRALSRLANALSRTATGVAIRDLTGGFNAWRADALRAVDPSSVRADGYGYLVELKVRAARRGARTVEVPIRFTERREGQSKLSRRVILEAAGVVLRLALSK